MKPFQFTAIPGKVVYLSKQNTVKGIIESRVIGIVTKEFADEIERLHETCKLMQKFIASLPPIAGHLPQDVMQRQNRQAMSQAIKRVLS